MLRAAVVMSFLSLGPAGCSASLVAASVGAVSTASVATYDCGAHVVVTVRDRQGNQHCGAAIAATRDGKTRRLDSCGWVSLGAGTWHLSEVGAPPGAGMTLGIEPASGCNHDVYSVELDRETQSS